MRTQSRSSLILDRLFEHAQANPDRLAYRFLHNVGEPECVTFGELGQRVRALARQLETYAAPGERAVLLYPPGLEFVAAFLACLASGIIAVPAYPPRRNRKADRLEGILLDCSPTLVLTTAEERRKFMASVFGTGAFHVLATDQPTAPRQPELESPVVGPEDVAFLQYTSGATGVPKGVIVKHAQLAANLEQIRLATGATAADTLVSWLPMFHDMGLVGGVLQPIYVGFPCIVLSPVSFLQEPWRWLKAIGAYRGTITVAPNFAFDHCVRHVTAEQAQRIDLSSLRLVLNGSEPIRSETLDRFTERFAARGLRPGAFFPCYGLAEATLMISGGPHGDEPHRLRVDSGALEAGRLCISSSPGASGRCLVSSGRPASGVRVVAVDPATRTVVPDGQVGELWVASPSVCTGYWGRADESRETFENHLAGQQGPFLNTGDMGFLDSGEVYVAGRSKDLIIVRGRNIYPQDVESAVERVLPFLATNSCAAFGLEVAGQERLAVVAEADRALSRSARARAEGSAEAAADSAHLAAIVGDVRRAIGDTFEATVHVIAFTRPGAFPRTSSGKVRRHACRDGLLAGTLELAHIWRETSPSPRVPVPCDGDSRGGDPQDRGRSSAGRHAPGERGSELMQKIYAVVIRWVRSAVDPRAEEIDPDVSLQSLGLDSLGAAWIARDVEQETGVRITPDIIYETQSIRRLSDYLEGRRLREIGAEGYSAHLDRRSAGGLPVARPRTLPDETLATQGAPAAIEPARYRLEDFPEVRALRDRIGAVRERGPLPYFRVHAGVARSGTVIAGRPYINFSSYNYLGLSGDRDVTRAAVHAAARYGTSVSASRVVSGERPIHRELEVALARFLGCEDAMVLVSGHATNVSVLGHLLGADDLIVHDALAHDSILGGARLCGARRRSFAHNDMDALEDILAAMRPGARRVLIAVEGVYSMDGDLAPLDRLIALKRRYKALLYVDEAHSLGVVGRTGRGIGEQFGVDRGDVDLWMGTLSKSLASCGGYIAGSAAVVEYLKYSAPGFVYSVGISPANAAAALAALEKLEARPGLVTRLQRRSRFFLELCCDRGINTGSSAGSAVVPCIVGDSAACLRLAEALAGRGINVQPILAPAVPEHQARLRFFITARHTEAQLNATADALAEEWARLELDKADLVAEAYA